MATTLTTFYSTFVMPSWRVMLTSQREDEQATLHRTTPVQLVSTATSSKQRLLTEVLGGGIVTKLTSKLRLLERGVFLNLVVCAVTKNTTLILDKVRRIVYCTVASVILN